MQRQLGHLVTTKDLLLYSLASVFFKILFIWGIEVFIHKITHSFTDYENTTATKLLLDSSFGEELPASFTHSLSINSLLRTVRELLDSSSLRRGLDGFLGPQLKCRGELEQQRRPRRGDGPCEEKQAGGRHVSTV